MKKLPNSIWGILILAVYKVTILFLVGFQIIMLDLYDYRSAVLTLVTALYVQPAMEI